MNNLVEKLRLGLDGQGNNPEGEPIPIQGQARQGLGSDVAKRSDLNSLAMRADSRKIALVSPDAASSATDLDTTVDRLLQRAEEHDAVQQFQEVIGLCEEVLSVASICGAQRARALRLVSKAYFFQGRYDKAKASTKEEVELRGQLGDQEGYAKSLNNLGLIALDEGDYRSALEHLLACFNHVVHSGLEMYALTSACLVNIGRLYQELQDSPKAAQYFALGIEAAVNAGDIGTEIAGLTGLGMLLREDQQSEKALQQFSHALQLAQQHSKSQDEAELLDNLGQVYAELGDYALARQKFTDALVLARSLGATPSEVNALINLGTLELTEGRPAQAVIHLHAGLELARTTDNLKSILSLSDLIAEAHGRLENTVQEVFYLKETLRLERLVKFEEHQQKAHDFSHQLETERANHQAEAYRLLNETAQQAKHQAEEEVRQQTHELELARREVVMRLGIAAEYRDDKTGSHTQRVSQLSARLAQRIGLSCDDVELIRLAARLHDIGKIGIPDAILLKTGKLTVNEFEIMKHHTTIGARMLQGGRTKLLQMAEEIAQHHHERWDGSGYPMGQAGERIPVVARIVALADVWDALTTERPYKEAWSSERALLEITAQSGMHFDPALTETFVSMVREVPLDLNDAVLAEEGKPFAPIPQRQFRNVGGLQGEGSARIQRLNQRAWTCRHTDPEQSVLDATEALALSEQHEDREGMGESLRTLAFSALSASDYRTALDRLNMACVYAEGLSDKFLLRDCKNLLSWLYKALHNSSEAVKNLLESLELSKHLQDDLGQANALANLGVLSSTRLNDREGAERYFQEAYEVHTRLGNVSGQANCLYNIADNQVELGKYTLAHEYGLLAVEAARATRNPVLEAVSLATVARALAGHQEYLAAAKCLDEATVILAENNVDSADASGWIHLYLGINLMHLERWDDAVDALTGVLNDATHFDLQDLLIRGNHELAILYQQQGKFELAMRHLENERLIEKTFTKDQTAERTQAMMMQYEVEKVQTEAEIYRIRTIELAEMNVTLEKVNREKSVLLVTLQNQATMLERQVREDMLTGLYNRRHIEDLMQEQFQKCAAEGTTFCVAMIDVDHFKRINDSFSHAVGDEVLRRLGTIFQNVKRSVDAVGRYGGEEFVLMMPNTSIEMAGVFVDHLRKAVQDAPWHSVAPSLQVTLSIGAADNQGKDNYEKIVAAADYKLYEAKHHRNAVKF